MLHLVVFTLIDLYVKCLRYLTLARNVVKIYSLKLALGVS